MQTLETLYSVCIKMALLVYIKMAWFRERDRDRDRDRDRERQRETERDRERCFTFNAQSTAKRLSG